MGKFVAVAIGIKRAGGLSELPGAVNGAKQIHNWVERQGYESHLVTDATGEVTLARVKSLIKGIVDKGEAERLLIYFAGHGIQPVANSAYWLLSRWDEDSDEAVNVNLSFANAKRTGIVQIAVFADACRSSVPEAATVGGGSIFPKPPSAAGRLPQWDHFLASRLGEVAQEVPGRDTATAYGIFTQCVMRALSGKAQEAVSLRTGKKPTRAVTSATLANFLETAVPLESGKTPGAAVQFPEVISGWRDPLDIYLALPETAPTLSMDDQRPPDPLSGMHVKYPEAAREAVIAATNHFDALARKTAAELGERQRQSPESDQGLTIVGADAIEVVLPGGEPAELLRENGAARVRTAGDAARTAMIRLDDGRWLAAWILPQFVGTIVVKDGLAASINYVPTRLGAYVHQSFEEIEPILNHWTALMQQGRFADHRELRCAAERMRMYKHQNPSLGILAAYAYERIGDIAEIDGMAEYFFGQGQPIPFDVALLSTKTAVRAAREFIIPWGQGSPAHVAGAFPLMTQGWSYLDPNDQLVHPALVSLRQGLLPGLWVTLRAREGEELAFLVRQGKL